MSLSCRPAAALPGADAAQLVDDADRLPGLGRDPAGLAVTIGVPFQPVLLDPRTALVTDLRWIIGVNPKLWVTLPYRRENLSGPRMELLHRNARLT